MKIGIIVQARMGSTRLPGKVLKLLGKEAALEVEFNQLRRCKSANAVILATSDAPEDKALVEFAEKLGIPSFAGSLGDVLDRFYRAARENRLDVVVRVTGDCPLHDPDVVDKVVSAFISADVDYASNVDPPTYPDGLDTEVFTFEALEEAWKQTKSAVEREHVTPFIRVAAKKRGRSLNVTNATDLSAHRWTLDRPEDLVFISKVYASLPQRFGLQDVLEVLAKHPDYRAVNRHIARNEKYPGDPNT